MYGGAGADARRRRHPGADARRRAGLRREGAVPPATAGVLTQGSGDIQFYARDSILLGQSRVMTTFGGSILAWSAQATSTPVAAPRPPWSTPRRPAATTASATWRCRRRRPPPAPASPRWRRSRKCRPATWTCTRRWVPSTRARPASACRATSTSMPSRCSTPPTSRRRASVGVPVAASVNTGALSSASAAASSAVGAAQDSARARRIRRARTSPSIISVQILGFGDEPTAGAASSPPRPSPERQTYRRDGAAGGGRRSAGRHAAGQAERRRAQGCPAKAGRGNKRIAAPRRLAYLTA